MYLGDKELGSPTEVIDWDTYENGVWQESPVHNTLSFYSTGNYTTYGARELKTPTVNASTWGDYIRSWWSYSYAPTAEMDSGYTIANADPYLAIWDCVNGSWLGVAPLLEDSYGRISYSTSSNTNFKLFYQNLSSLGNTCIFVPLTADPGDISGWRDYDGPDDWDTWEDGVYRTVSNNSVTNPVTELKVGSLTASTGFRWLGTEVRLNGIDQSVAPAYVAIWFPAQDTGIGSPITERWELYSFADGSQNSAGNSNFNYVESSDGSSKLPTNRLYDCFVVLLTRQPNDITTWRDYDGPMFASWDEPARHTLVSAVDQGFSGAVVNVEYYENTSFWSSIVQSPPGTYIPAELRRSGADLITMYNAGGSSMNQATLTSLVPKAAVHMANYTSPYNGWLWSTPAATGGFKAEYPFTVSSGLDYNTFYTYAPMVLTLYSEEVGDIRYWPAYDGPVANWDTYANGVYIADDVGASTGSTLIQIPAYDSTTYTSPPTITLWADAGSPVSNGFYFEDPRYDPTQSIPDSQKPPYIAVYVHDYSADGDFGDMPPGWYVFENYDQTFRPRGRTTWEKPVAWPTPSGNYNFYSNVIDTGYMGNVNEDGSGVIYVFLDEYNDPVGSGGTDHWTKPPIVIAGDISSIDTATDRIGLGSLKRYGQAPGVEIYSYLPIRIDSNNVDGSWIVNAESPALGVLDTEVFLNGTKISEAPWTHSAQTTGTPRLTIDFSTVGVYADWTDFETSAVIGDSLILVIYNP
jgi:hypothetical protein